MPELPEVETMRRGVAHLVGQRITAVHRPRSRCKPILLEPAWRSFRRRVIGRTLWAFDRLGKRVVARLDDGQAIVFEPRMTGLILVADPPSNEHLRLTLQLDGSRAVASRPEGGHSTPEARLMYWDRRGLGSVRLWDEAALARKLGPDRLGPDALVATADVLAQRLGSCRRPLKVALMDQRLVAGIGNLYASEILHVAGIHPARSCNRVGSDEWRKIRDAVQLVLREAILHEGSTLSDGTYRNALSQDGGYQNYHRVYDRADQLCSHCKSSTIQRIVQAQRSTFFCAGCQRF